MAKWIFQPDHTSAEFKVRHMMVTYVRGAFKKVRGMLTFDPADPGASSAQVTIDAKGIWTGDPNRDAHLRSANFLDVENHPEITFRGDRVEMIGDHDYRFSGELTIRGVSRPATLRVRYLGQWQTPWWEEEQGEMVNKGPKTRAGFAAETEISRQDFGISWNDTIDNGGVVVGDTVFITIDVEAILQEPAVS